MAKKCSRSHSCASGSAGVKSLNIDMHKPYGCAHLHHMMSVTEPVLQFTPILASQYGCQQCGRHCKEDSESDLYYDTVGRQCGHHVRDFLRTFDGRVGRD